MSNKEKHPSHLLTKSHICHSPLTPFFTIHLSLFNFWFASLPLSVPFLLRSSLVQFFLESPGIPIPLCMYQKMPLQCCHITTMSSSSSPASPRVANIFCKLYCHLKASFQSQNCAFNAKLHFLPKWNFFLPF